MRKLLIAAGLTAALLVPAGAVAKPNKTDARNASQQCRAERGTTTASREAFADFYGTNKNNRNAFGKCVSRKTREEHRERHAAKRKAARDCAAKHSSTSRAYRNCVRRRARAEKRRMDREDREARVARRNAAQQCDDERGDTTTDRATFAAKYGTNENDANAFGKCVSEKAQAQN